LSINTCQELGFSLTLCAFLTYLPGSCRKLVYWSVVCCEEKNEDLVSGSWQQHSLPMFLCGLCLQARRQARCHAELPIL